MGNYPQCDIMCDPKTTIVASKLELKALSMLLGKGNNRVQI